MKYVVVIPARGGSKGVPGKNIKLLNGKPLISYTIEAAREVFPDNQIIVSTDDAQIKSVVENAGLTVPFLRPAELAADTSGTYEVLLHAADFHKKNGGAADVLVLLQPTSPFRSADQIRQALSLYHHGLDMVVSVKEAKSNPYYNLFEDDADGFLRKSKPGKYTRRQDCPKVWEYNGAIYVINMESLLAKPLSAFEKVIKYEMDERSSHDIDTMFDWQIAESLLKTH